MMQGDSETVQSLVGSVRGVITEHFELGELYERTNNVEALCFVGTEENVTSPEKVDIILKTVYEMLRNVSQLPCSVRSNTPGTWKRAYPDQTRVA